ncbi:penicillin-binding transpeptidase domain-containing protein [Corynebacterium pyruviciproducens]|uniref:penicillin-binding transpeptidase domain-containing protein n=1 Tax=Corynebacterium pyruviciproducens TaxID=598660 RepID=UPI002550B38A|nr:penicillin-binding protein 2 [Corynebacterium pyruviciproducens]MDK7214223.1 penicillin-binding protein 2 [Corynebacterium pyruviciproducens]
MNRTIRIASLFSLVLVFILLVNLTWVQVFRTDELADNPLNRRQFYRAQMIARGPITAGGEVLAHSEKQEDGTYERRYGESAPLYGPTIGYLDPQFGAAGLEASQNDVLNGENTVKLTVDPKIQQAAYQGLSSRGYEGAAVAIKASTGEILAIASTPSYNPATVTDNWEELSADEMSPLLNHATQDSLPPGSTFKVITTAAALMNGYTPGSPFTGASQITLPGTTATLENYGGGACAGGGTVSLTTAFALSCNTAFAQLGSQLTEEQLTKTAQAFGVGETYDLGLPESAGALGDLTDAAARAQSAIGQRDVSMTALQNAVVAATVANDGLRMKPYIVSEVLGRDLKVKHKTTPTEAAEVMPKEVSDQIAELMRASERSTLGYQGGAIASKTGTAEHGEDSRNSEPHVWYIAFEGDVAVAVVVKNGGDQGARAVGATTAAPIGREILGAARG